MRYEQIRRAPLSLELVEKIQHLRANRHVESGNRFVRNDEGRLHNHSSCKAYTLALSARKLVRITREVFGEQTDFFDHLLDFCNSIRFVFEEVEVVKAFGHDIVDGRALVERCGGILEHHLDVPDDLSVEFMRNIARNAHALVLNLALCARVDSDDCASDGGFSRTGFADERKRFAFIDVERRVFDCFYSLVALAESDVNVLDGQQNFSAVFVERTLFRESIFNGGIPERRRALFANRFLLSGGIFDMLLLLHCEFLFDGRGVIQCGGLDIVDYFVFVHHSTSSILNALSNLP